MSTTDPRCSAVLSSVLCKPQHKRCAAVRACLGSKYHVITMNYHEWPSFLKNLRIWTCSVGWKQHFWTADGESAQELGWERYPQHRPDEARILWSNYPILPLCFFLLVDLQLYRFGQIYSVAMVWWYWQIIMIFIVYNIYIVLLLSLLLLLLYIYIWF